MNLDDADHYSPERRAEIRASYPEHERDARTEGYPKMGSGLVFPVDFDSLLCEPFAIPKEWYRVRGIDFGWDHPFAAIDTAWDRDADVIYWTKEYRQREQTPIIHAAAIDAWGEEWVPIAWPHDGLQMNVDKSSSKQLAQLYRECGLNLLPEHATHEAGGYGLEGGIIEILDRMKTGRLKVFRHLSQIMGEARSYHRVEGIIVAERDDLLSAGRYASMMRRFSETVPVKRTASGRRAGGWMGA